MTPQFMTHKEVNTMGEPFEAPGPLVSPETLKAEFDEVRRILVVRFEYERIVRYFPTDKVKVVKFTYDRRGDFSK